MRKALAQAAAIVFIVVGTGVASCPPEKTYRTPPGTVEVPCGNWPPDRADDDSPCYRILSTTPGGTK